MNHSEFIFFSSFIAFIIAVLALDLGFFDRRSHIIKFKEAVIWFFFWLGMGLAFYFVVRYHGDWIHGIESKQDITIRIEKFMHPINIDNLSYEDALEVYKKNLGLEYLTGYFIEKALSVDNIFVMVMIFLAFGVGEMYYKRVLMWGIIGALVLRFIFIFTASALIQEFNWVLYIFGLLLIFTGVKMFITRHKKEEIDVSKHPVVKFTSKYFRVHPHYDKHHFFIKKDGKQYLTPLFIVLLVIEFSDVIFAVDSIPAIFSVTKDPYVVFFSNVFAILGLRALFFLVMNIIHVFHYLKLGLSVLLTFIGLKMIFHHWLKEIGFQTSHSLYIVLGILVVSIVASLIFPAKDAKPVQDFPK